MLARRRRLPTETRLSHARIAAFTVVCVTAAVTYVSVNTLVEVVHSSHISGVDSLASDQGEKYSGSWSNSARLASERSTEKIGTQHQQTDHDSREPPPGSSGRLTAPSGSNHTSQQVGIRVGKGADLRKSPPFGGTAASDGGGSGGGLPTACHAQTNTDFVFGHAVKWGPQNKVDSARDCCNACRDYRPASDDGPSCNVWVWCGEKAGCGGMYRDCWLKHLPRPDGVVPSQGPLVPWTAGIINEAQAEEEIAAQDPLEDRSFHTVITADGSATHWQSRIGYYFYQKTRKACLSQGACQMGGFTRILHSGKADDLMGEIPTFIAQPLPQSKAGGNSYIVINRPYALVQWTQQTSIKENYVLMSEPDHLWLRPMPNLMKAHRPAAFAFFYIEPSKPEFKPITERFTGKLTLKQAESIAPMGSAPTMMALDDLKRVAPLWQDLGLAIFNDSDANREWGWVLEMYAFTIAVYNAGILNVDLHPKMMGQPPWDTGLEPYYILHYTYGNDYNLDGKFTPGKIGAWRFDKRSYMDRPPPRHLPPPPPGIKNMLVRKIVDAINEASDTIPGWDSYHQTGVAEELWDGNTFGTSHVISRGMEVQTL